MDPAFYVFFWGGERGSEGQIGVYGLGCFRGLPWHLHGFNGHCGHQELETNHTGYPKPHPKPGTLNRKPFPQRREADVRHGLFRFAGEWRTSASRSMERPSLHGLLLNLPKVVTHAFLESNCWTSSTFPVSLRAS